MRYTEASTNGKQIVTLDDLKEYCSFDADLSGDNGIDYTDELAIEAGFQCTGDYLFDLAVKSSDVFKEQIKKALDLICETDPEYMDPEIYDLQDGTYFVTISIIS